MSAHECAYQNQLQKYIFFCKYTIVQTRSHLIKTKYHLAAEPAGLSYTKPSEVYFGGKSMTRVAKYCWWMQVAGMVY